MSKRLKNVAVVVAAMSCFCSFAYVEPEKTISSSAVKYRGFIAKSNAAEANPDDLEIYILRKDTAFDATDFRIAGDTLLLFLEQTMCGGCPQGKVSRHVSRDTLAYVFWFFDDCEMMCPDHFFYVKDVVADFRYFSKGSVRRKYEGKTLIRDTVTTTIQVSQIRPVNLSDARIYLREGRK